MGDSRGRVSVRYWYGDPSPWVQAESTQWTRRTKGRTYSEFGGQSVDYPSYSVAKMGNTENGRKSHLVIDMQTGVSFVRSEERRVGKECRL